MPSYKAKDCFIHRKIGGDDLLIPTGKQVFTENGLIMMNETAIFLWNQIAQPKSIDELCDCLALEYGVEPAQVREDAEEFIKNMESLDALEIIEQ